MSETAWLLVPLRARPCEASLDARDQLRRLLRVCVVVNYMLDTYGPARDAYDPKALWPLLTEAVFLPTATLATLVRGNSGSQRQPNARADNEEMLPLELWGYEVSPFVRPVREKLCGLALKHVIVPTARGSANRDRLVAKTGVQFQVPYLVDPNTGVELFESPEILEYLEQVYTT